MHAELCSIRCRNEQARVASSTRRRRWCRRCVRDQWTVRRRARPGGGLRLEKHARATSAASDNCARIKAANSAAAAFRHPRGHHTAALQGDGILAHLRQQRVALAGESQPARIHEQRLALVGDVHGHLGRRRTEHVDEVIAAQKRNASLGVEVHPARTQRPRTQAQVEHRLRQCKRKEVDEAGILEDADRARHGNLGATCSNACAGCAGGSPVVRMQEDDSKRWWS